MGAFDIFNYDPLAESRRREEERRGSILRRSWEMLKGITGTVANVPGAATGAIAGLADPASYWKAYEAAVASTGKPEGELSLPEILRVAPGVGEVATANWEPESPLGQAGKSVAMLAGNIATDPLTYATGGIGAARRALALRRAGQLGLMTTRAGLLGAEGAKGILPHVVGGVLASPVPAAISYGPELVGGVAQGLRQAYEGAREGDFEKILAGGVQTASLAGLGAGMGKGIAREFRPMRSALAGVRARQALAPEMAIPPEPAVVPGAGFAFSPSDVAAPVRPQPIGEMGLVPPVAPQDELEAILRDLEQSPGVQDARREVLRRRLLEQETPITAEFRVLPEPPELPAGTREAGLAKRERPRETIQARPRVVVPGVEDLVSRRLQELRGREQRALPAGDDVKAAERGGSDLVTSEAATKSTQKPPEEGGPVYAYRVRDVGERGVPSVESHSQFSMSEIDVRKMAPSRSEKPQEVIRVNLKNFRPEEYREISRPDQPSWVKMERPVDESEVEVVGKITEIDADAASKAALTPGLEEAVLAIERDPDGLREIGVATGLDEAQVRRGIAQVRADRMEEFGPEAIAVKRAILASGRHKQFALDKGAARAEIGREEPGAGLPTPTRAESIVPAEPMVARVPSAEGPRPGALESPDRGDIGLPGREGPAGAGRGVAPDTTRAAVPVTEGVPREAIEDVSRPRTERVERGDEAGLESAFTSSTSPLRAQGPAPVRETPVPEVRRPEGVAYPDRSPEYQEAGRRLAEAERDASARQREVENRADIEFDETHRRMLQLSDRDEIDIKSYTKVMREAQDKQEAAYAQAKKTYDDDLRPAREEEHQAWLRDMQRKAKPKTPEPIPEPAKTPSLAPDRMREFELHVANDLEASPYFMGKLKGIKKDVRLSKAAVQYKLGDLPLLKPAGKAKTGPEYKERPPRPAEMIAALRHGKGSLYDSIRTRLRGVYDEHRDTIHDTLDSQINARKADRVRDSAEPEKIAPGAERFEPSSFERYAVRVKGAEPEAPPLIALHKTTPEAIERASKSGFPVPSIGVTAGKVYAWPSPITLIGDRTLADPQARGNVLYPGDAGTPPGFVPTPKDMAEVDFLQSSRRRLEPLPSIGAAKEEWKKRGMPTSKEEFFEAKPGRNVRLEEFKAAVMPSSPEFDSTAKILEGKGVRVSRVQGPTSWGNRKDVEVRDYNARVQAEVDSLVRKMREEGRDVRFAVRPSPLGFYSRLSRVVDDTRTPAKGKASDLLRFLKDPKRQVKKDELYWTGLEDYLKAKGEDRVTREEIAQFLSEREIKVSEKTLGAPIQGAVERADDALTDVLKGYGISPETSRELALDAAREDDGLQKSSWWLERATDKQKREAGPLAVALREAYQKRDVAGKRGEDVSKTKFSQWQEPGGENYREVLLTLPNAPRKPAPRDVTPDAEAIAKFAPQWDPLSAKLKTIQAELSRLLGEPDSETKNYRMRMDRDIRAGIESELDGIHQKMVQDTIGRMPPPEKPRFVPEEDFTSGHFTETPNVLLHLRLNDRTDADGKRVLFVEEIQSDWAQKGRSEGFGGGLSQEDRDALRDHQERLDKIDEERANLNHRIRTYSEIEGRESAHVTGLLKERVALDDERPTHAEAIRELESMRGRIPSAPFVESTEAWTGLALKRIFRMAAEGGYDRVAWTTGDMQAARYDLSKHIDSLQWDLDKNKAGNRVIKLVGTKDGHAILDTWADKTNLADTIGKEASEKILREADAGEMGGTLRGLDLKVGGEGMRGYYDEIVPQIANKIGKQWDAKVGETTLALPYPRGAARIVLEGAAENRSVPSIDITPQMRESVMLGQPLFSARKPRPAVDARPPRFVEVKSVLGPLAEKGPDNSTFYLKTPAGRVEFRWTNETIRINPEALKAEYGEGVKPEEVEAVGVHIPWEGLIKLRQGAADLGVVGHEAWHAVKDGMRMAGQWDDAFDDLLRKQYKTEAGEADAFAAWAKKTAEGPRSVFERVASWINRMLRAFMPDWRNVFERSFRSAAEGPAEKAIGGPAPSYAVRPERIDPDALSPAVLARMSRTLKAKGFDIRGAEDVRSSLKGRMLDKDGKLWHEDWQDAYQKAISGEEARTQKATDLKAQTPHVSWQNVRGFPTTQDPRRADYVRPNGTLADMSLGSDVRADDHRIVGGTAGMQELVGRAGWIRWIPEGKGLDIGREPSAQQYRQIRNLTEQADGEIVLDLQRGLGEFDESNKFYRQETTSLEYPKGTRAAKILGDIRRYYAGEDVQPGVRYAVKPRAVAGTAQRPAVVPEVEQKEARTQESKGPEIEQKPAVEFKDEDYRRSLKEAQAAGARPNLRPLDREDAKAWDSYDKEISEINATVTDEQLYNRQRTRDLTVAEKMALASRVEAKKATVLAKRSALESLAPNADEFTRARVVKEYTAALLDSQAAQRAILNDMTGAGRALNAGRRVLAASMGPGDEWAQMRKILKEIPGIGNRQATDLIVIARQNPSALQDALHAAMKPGAMRKFIEWYKAGLLSAPGTQVANISGNSIEQGTRVVETALSSVVDRVLRGIHGGQRERFLAEAGAEMNGAMESFGPALGRLMQSLRSEVFTLKPEKIDLEGPSKFEHQVGAIGGKFGRGARTPFRALGVADDFFKDVGGMAELFKLATRKAARESSMQGKGIAEIRERAAKIIQEALDDTTGQHLDLIRMVEQSKVDRTFQTKLEEKAGVLPGFARFIQQAAETHPLLQMVVPFIRTPANIAQATIERSPLGWGKAIRVYRQFLDGKVSRGEVADAIAKPLLGSTIIGGFMAYAAGGGMTGSGPTDPDEKNLLRETGWQPYSFVLPGPDGKIYVPFNRFEPVSSLLGFAADMAEIRDQKKAGDIFDKALGSFVENLTSKTYLTGLSSAGALISRPKQFAGEWVRQISRGLVPNIIGRMAQAVDPVLRDVRPQEGGISGLPETALKTFASRLPGVSTLLPARRSATGKEITREGVGFGPFDAAARFALPVQPSAETKYAEVEKLLVQIGYVPAQPSRERTVKGRKVRVGDEDYEKLQRANEWATKEIQKSYMGNARFDRLPDTMEEGGKQSKEYYIRRVFDEARERTAAILNRSSDWQRRVRESRRAYGQANP